MNINSSLFNEMFEEHETKKRGKENKLQPEKYRKDGLLYCATMVSRANILR